ncbi:uncharacterized protein TNCV_2221301 [Trichonephila clavipes]|nr:uncharacterized protein TNCV_2221301 [Trichonephila clavipes]
MKGHLRGRVPDWFEVIGCSLLQGTATDFAQLKEALTKNFPVVRNRSELEKRLYSTYQVRGQAPSDFVYDLLKIHMCLKLDVSENKLLEHIISRLEPQILDYVAVRNPITEVQLLQLVIKYEERYTSRETQGPIDNIRKQDWDARRRFLDRHKDGNWRDSGVIKRQNDIRIRNKDSNGFRSHGDEGTVIPIQSPYASPVVLCSKKNGLPLDSPEAYRSRSTQLGTEGSISLAREKNKVEQWREKRRWSALSTDYSTNQCLHRQKRRRRRKENRIKDPSLRCWMIAPQRRGHLCTTKGTRGEYPPLSPPKDQFYEKRCSSRGAVAAEERPVRSRQVQPEKSSPYDLRNRHTFSGKQEQSRIYKVQSYKRRSKGTAHQEVHSELRNQSIQDLPENRLSRKNDSLKVLCGDIHKKEFKES